MIASNGNFLISKYILYAHIKAENFHQRIFLLFVASRVLFMCLPRNVDKAAQYVKV